MATHKKGTVGIEEHQGYYRLRLPRAIADTSRYISTGLPVTPENYKRVQTVAWQIEADITAGTYHRDKYLPRFKTKPALQNLTELWQRFCDYKEPGQAPATRRRYLRTYTGMIARLPIQNPMDALGIRSYLMNTYGKVTAKRMHQTLSACCEWAVQTGQLEVNAFATLKVPATKGKPIDPFTKREVCNILYGFESDPDKKWMLSYIKFLFWTGCRPGEASGLQWKHIDEGYQYITFSSAYDAETRIRRETKTSETRVFKCNRPLRTLLESLWTPQAQPNSSVFTYPDGRLLSQKYVQKHGWMVVVKDLALSGDVERYRPMYNARATFITTMLEKGLPIHHVAKLVSNSPKVILEHYAGLPKDIEVPEL